MKVYTNRSSVVFERVEKDFNKKITDYTLMPVCNNFVYWDSFYKEECPIAPYIPSIQNISNSYVNYISNKKLCAERIKDLKLQDYYATTYNSKSEIKELHKTGLYFIKNSYSSEVKCVDGTELKTTHVSKDHIIQEAVSNLQCINDKKFVIRAFIIIHDKKMYVSRHALCTVFTSSYNENTTNPMKHIGINFSECISLQQTEFKDCIYTIQKTCMHMKSLFTPIINRSHEYMYAIIGANILLKKDNSIKFIGFNAYPTLTYDHRSNREVIEKMLCSVLKLTLLKKNETDLLDTSKPKREKCNFDSCRKKLSSFSTTECICGLKFCSFHRQTFDHNCSHLKNQKKQMEHKLEKENPAIKNKNNWNLDF